MIMEKRKTDKVRESNEWSYCDCEPSLWRAYIAPSVTKENSRPQSLFWYLGKWNKKLFKYFYRMSWTSYKSEWLDFFFFFEWAFVGYLV